MSKNCNYCLASLWVKKKSRKKLGRLKNNKNSVCGSFEVEKSFSLLSSSNEKLLNFFIEEIKSFKEYMPVISALGNEDLKEI